ncbi:MAG: ubiquinone biosynthesis protein [Nocardioides sp.]|nr:ubiquinone biosynthesis protein [Nocardioides sp.]
MRLPAVPGLGGWGDDPAWGVVYDATVEHPRLGRPLWRLGVGADLDRLHRAVRAVGSLPDGGRVLDVPCGGGIGLRGLRTDQEVDYLAADLSPVMLARTGRVAERLGVADRVRLLRADVAHLPLPDDHVDLVLSFTGLHCFPDPVAAVHEMARVLRPGGMLSLSTLVEDSGPRYLPLRVVGRAAGLLGPGITQQALARELDGVGLHDVRLVRDGAMVWVTAVA